MKSKSTKRYLPIAIATALCLLAGWKVFTRGTQSVAAVDGELPLSVFFDVSERNPKTAEAARELISNNWRPGYAIMLNEQMKFTKAPYLMARILKQHVPGYADYENWNVGIWNHPYEPHSQYAEFKSKLYSQIDPRFAEHFNSELPTSIRLDEIQWGGVKRDGIPPLDKPTMINGSEADYMEDSNIVFGIEINGDARAYPKRILGWHEMFRDTIGGESVNGVYCTLCSTMILYKTTFNGVHHELGTSGFLYRSNKLMYDRETKSLWSTLNGAPVVGPLVGKGIVLETLPVVTTTWGKWRREKPTTKVLSLETGHERDYREGAAYADYYDSPYLMFEVPEIDKRMPIKDEVLAIRHGDLSKDALAISVDFLSQTPVYSDTVDGTDIVILTCQTGSSRVYKSIGITFAEWDGSNTAKDDAGNSWVVNEDAINNVDTGTSLPRLPAHRSFWFAWYSMHPETRLIQ